MVKHILALPTWRQKCTFTELQPFLLAKYSLCHPVQNAFQNSTKLNLSYENDAGTDSNWFETSLNQFFKSLTMMSDF